jgi:hypothetical protein
MINLAMKRKLEAGEALDVRRMMTQVEPAGGALVFRLTGFVEGVDYCDAETERWIWSIGRSLLTGSILASTDTRFYQHPEFDCLWLR